MKKSVITLLVAVVLFTVLANGFIADDHQNWSSETPVSEILKAFGEGYPSHARPNADEATIKRGYDLIHQGKTIGPDGKMSNYISKYFVCTSCHNQDREDPVLNDFNPDTRLDYVAKKGMKFLQGSTFFGIANRESWYNDDYYLKYGDLVKPANKSLAEATQLCAKVCSSGRYLEDWELEAILAYYWSNQVTLGELALSTSEKEKLLQSKDSDGKEMISFLKGKYGLKSPATFGEEPHDKLKGYPFKGNPENGKKIFELSCQSCHSYDGVSGMAFENSKLTFQKFKRNLNKEDVYNIYDISRHGTYVGQGKPRYMPLYPKERMSDQQLEDLKAYILQEAS